MPPLCSVIVPVYNLAAITRQCLDHLLADPPRSFDREIVVVDDGSRDETRAMLGSFGDRIRVVRHDVNLGFSRGCNDGAAAAEGRYLVFLNNDTLPLPGWLDSLVSYAQSHPEAAAVGARLLYPDGTIQHAGMAIDADLEPRHLYLGFPADHPAVGRSRAFPMVTGACMLVPRAAFEAAGGFDTRFVNGYEDVDFCLRMGELGREIHYCAESTLIHLESISEGRTDRDAANHDLYCRRWKPRLRPNDVLFYQQDGLLRLVYGANPAVRLRIAPELGVIDDDSRHDAAQRLLAERSRQVYELLKENIGLRVRRASESLSA